MSSSFDREDKDWLNSMLLQGRISRGDVNNMFNAFEAQTDHDVETIKQQLIHEKWLRRVCLYKCLMFPTELVVLFTILGYKSAVDHASVVSLYYQFLRKKIDFTKFQTSLSALISKGKLV